MHPDLLKRIAHFSERNPGVGLPFDLDKVEQHLAFSEAIEAQTPLLIYIGSVVARHYLLEEGGLPGQYEEQAAQLELVATELSNDLCAELDAYTLNDDPDRTQPVTLAGLISAWLSTRFN